MTEKINPALTSTSGQSYFPRRHPTCWASLHKNHTVSSKFY